MSVWLRVTDDRADSIVEAAIVLALLGVPLLAGTADTAVIVYGTIEVSNAAYAGAVYGMRSATFAGNSSGISAAGQAEAADFGTALHVSSNAFYACSSFLSGMQYSSQATANAACSGSGNHALEFVQVNVSVPVTLPFRYQVLGSTYTLTGSSVMEVVE